MFQLLTICSVASSSGDIEALRNQLPDSLNVINYLGLIHVILNL